MSSGARWTLGSFALLFAGIFEFTALSSPSILSSLFCGFCLVIAVACFSRALRGPAVRLVGLLVFLLCLAYFIGEVWLVPAHPYRGESQPHWMNAVKVLTVFGLPALYVALVGQYPSWGEGAKAFRRRKR